MKLRYVISILLIIAIIIYGWHFYVDAFSNINSNRQLRNDLSEAKQGVLENEQYFSELLSTFSTKYDVPSVNNYYDYLVLITDNTGSTINKITGKKIVDNASTTIMSCSDINEVHDMPQVDILEVVFLTENTNEFLNYVTESKLAIDKVILYPLDNCILVDFIAMGGN